MGPRYLEVLSRKNAKNLVIPPSTSISNTESASCNPDWGRAFILLSILNANTLFGLFNQSSGGISLPVKGDILSISNSLFFTTSCLKFILGGFGKGTRGGELPKQPFL